MDSMDSSVTVTKNSPEAQKASCNSVPSSVDSHKNPEVMPVAGKCMQGANIK